MSMKRVFLFLIVLAPSTAFSRFGANLIQKDLIEYQINLEANKSFIWSETDTGATCPPAIGPSFSDVTGESPTGSFILQSECAWFNNLSAAALDAAQTFSDCVPLGSLFVTITNEYSWELLDFNLQNVRRIECFMNRFLIVTLDDESLAACKNATGIVHCLRYDHTLKPSDFKQSDYMAITWIKSKLALVLVNLGLLPFIFDADVLFFQVPDISAVLTTNPRAKVFHQLELMDYPALYRTISSLGASRVNENDYGGVMGSKVNSGQMLWVPSNVSYEALPLAMRYGADGTTLDQEHIENAVNQISPESLQPLSYMYVSHCTGQKSVVKHSKNWITYHANCLKGMKNKLEAVRFAQRSWEALQREEPSCKYAFVPSALLIALIVCFLVRKILKTLFEQEFLRPPHSYSYLQ